MNAGIESLEAQVDAWRVHLRRSRAVTEADAEELEDHLREELESLGAAGLSADEGFLVAVKRIGAIHAVTREFAREHSERLWKQLVLADGVEGRGGTLERRAWVALALAIAAGAAMKLPELFGIELDSGRFHALHVAFFTFPFVAAWFAWERRLARSTGVALVAAFALAALALNLAPFAPEPGSDTEVLTMLHLPIALWLLVGVAYVGGRWRGSERRMDFVRFTGELGIYYVLLALGGLVLIGLTFALFESIGIDAEPQVERWVAPCGVAGAFVIAAWLVEAKQSVVENMAPVLTRVFAPLFTLLLVAFLGTMAWTGRDLSVERELLIAFDVLLVVVFGLLLYTISARDLAAPAGLSDWIHLTLVVTALLVDALALWAIGSRITEFGFTPNRVAALGENLVLLVNLAGSALLYARFLRGRAPFARLLEWQTGYLYVLAAWAAIVAFLFPALFGGA